MTSDISVSAAETPAAEEHGQAHSTAPFKALMLGSIGVVYGDIGTSPLYAFREAINAASTPGATQPGIVLGVLSLILWTLIVVVTLKYVVILLRADNNGEGGTLALMALAQRSRGTARVAAFFGPLMCRWFAVIAVAAIPQIVSHPEVFQAFNPLLAVAFLLEHGVIGLITLGAVFLAVTGAEALYAALGHFGKSPIRVTWLAIVLPSLALNYLGQAALVMHNPAVVQNPFFLMFPDWALVPMVVLATVATVIASQAVITGAYSLTLQAVQLGLLPRFEIRHTSESHAGQIYIPRLNRLLFVAVLLLVMLFRSSSALASAYGIAVTGTMVVTGIMGFIVIWRVWKWSPLAAGLLMAPFLLFDLTFLAANLLKVFDGGWVPLAIGGVIMLLMYTWRKGSRVLFDKSHKQEIPLEDLVAMLEKKPPQRVPGTAVFLTSNANLAPTALMHSLKHYKVLHEKNVILTIENALW